MKQINIGERCIGTDCPVFIIAEIGSNHNNDLEFTKDSIAAAAEAGADAVKFQSLNAYKLYLDPPEEIRELHKKIDLNEKWYNDLRIECEKHKVEFFSSPTYFKAVELLEEVGVKLYKLASAQVGTFPQIIKKIAALNKPVILSTGIVSFSELENAIKIFEAENNRKYIILHCNSIYPTPPNKVHLPLMDVYRDMFDCPVGFSDHTEGIAVPIAATAMGADVIEKHFVLNKNVNTPDSDFSLDPGEFKEMVKCIRQVESAIVPASRINLQSEEQRFKDKIPYKLILKQEKKTGDGFIAEDFDYRRMEGGVDCRELEFVIRNMVAAVDIMNGTPLKWQMLKGKNE